MCVIYLYDSNQHNGKDKLSGGHIKSITAFDSGSYQVIRKSLEAANRAYYYNNILSATDKLPIQGKYKQLCCFSPSLPFVSICCY